MTHLAKDTDAAAILPSRDVPTVDLGDGAAAWIQTVPLRLDLPYGYFDALGTRIRSTSSTERVLLQRRIGYLGAAEPVRYSLIAYTIKGNREIAYAAGAAVDRQEAWIFDAQLTLADFPLGITRLLEQLAALPICAAAPGKYQAWGFCHTRQAVKIGGS